MLTDEDLKELPRLQEVLDIIALLEVPTPYAVAISLTKELQRDCYSDMSPGKSAVQDWVRLQLNDLGLIPFGSNAEPPKHVAGVFHFWSWDEETYGPWVDGAFQKPKQEGDGLARSPLERLIDATPIDRVAHRVTSVRQLLGLDHAE